MGQSRMLVYADPSGVYLSPDLIMMDKCVANAMNVYDRIGRTLIYSTKSVFPEEISHAKSFGEKKYAPQRKVEYIHLPDEIDIELGLIVETTKGHNIGFKDEYPLHAIIRDGQIHPDSETYLDEPYDEFMEGYHADDNTRKIDHLTPHDDTGRPKRRKQTMTPTTLVGNPDITIKINDHIRFIGSFGVGSDITQHL